MSVYGDCETAESGTEAIKKFKEFREKGQKFDLIILDHSLDDITGLEVLKKIRAIEKDAGIETSKKIKIIMATANQRVENVKACINAGCNHYILKPIIQENIKERLIQCGFIEDEQKPAENEIKKNPD